METLKEWYFNYQQEKREPKKNPLKELRKVLSFDRIINVVVPTVMSKSSPPFGPALAQYGVNVTTFCDQFNELTEEQDVIEDLEIPIKVYLRKEKTYDIFCKGFPLIELLDTTGTWLKGEGVVNLTPEVFIHKTIFFRGVNSGIKFKNLRKKLKLKKRITKNPRLVKKNKWIDILDLYKVYLIQEMHLNLYPNYTTTGLLKTILERIKKDYRKIIIENVLHEKLEYIHAKYNWRKKYRLYSHKI